MAKSVKGRARASENPNIPMAGEIKLDVAAASTSRVPMIGPVQEKDTRASVNAMKKMLRYPVVESTFESILLLHDAGRVISNPPMKEIAKSTRRRKKAMLKPAEVASSLRADAPKIAVTIRPSKTYITMIDAP